MATNQDFWLGPAGALVRLPSPNDGVDRPRTRGRTTLTTFDGGVAVVQRLRSKGQWNLPYSYLYEQDYETIRQYAEGSFGDGPFALIDPSVRNVLGPDGSTAGLRTNADLMWRAGAGTLTRGPVNPTDPRCASIAWSATTAVADRLSVYAIYDPVGKAWSVDPVRTPFVVPALAMTFSAVVSGAGQITFGLLCFTADGSQVASPVAPVVAALTGGYTPIALSVPAGGFGAGVAFASYGIQMRVGDSLSLSLPQIEYADTASSWSPGHGSPRVVITADPPDSVPQLGWTSTALSLAEQ